MCVVECITVCTVGTSGAVPLCRVLRLDRKAESRSPQILATRTGPVQSDSRYWRQLFSIRRLKARDRRQSACTPAVPVPSPLQRTCAGHYRNKGCRSARVAHGVVMMCSNSNAVDANQVRQSGFLPVDGDQGLQVAQQGSIAYPTTCKPLPQVGTLSWLPLRNACTRDVYQAAE